jgi:hypothetical protein
MCDILKDHMGKLLAETETAQKTLKAIEKEYPVWLWQWYAAEAARIKEYLYKLESEVTLIEVDCIEIMGRLYQGNGNNKVFEQCYLTYMSLDKLVDDLKDTRMNLNYPSVYYSDVQQLESDWMRFGKIISAIYQELKNNELNKSYRLI